MRLKTEKISLILMLLILLSCGKDKKGDAIRSANFFLTKKDCDSAIRVLEEAGRDNKDATYLRVLSSAYACKGNFDVIKLFSDDLSLFADPTPLAGASRFSTADDMTTATDSEYTNLQTAINILLYAGGLSTDTEPTSAARAGIFSTTDASEINMQLVYMLMIQIGRYFKYYGNTSVNGEKGLGAGANSCFLNYENVPLDNGAPADLATYFSAGLTGSCDNTNYNNSGHPDLGTVGSYNTARLCQGVVLLNVFFDIFPSVLGSIAGSDFPWVSDLSTLISDAKSQIENKKIGANAVVTNIMSQTNCETLNATDDDFLQVYFAVFMETLLQ